MTGKRTLGPRVRPLGPRPGRPDTRADIIRAAKRMFARGYGSCSLRAVAREAGVDPSLLVQFFGSKEGLYLAAIADVMRPDDVLGRIVGDTSDGLGRRLAAYYFDLWDDAETRWPFQAILLSAASYQPAAAILRDFITRELVARVAARAVKDRAELRAGLAGSHLVGTALVRYVVRFGPLAELPRPELAEIVGGTIDGYLFGPLPAAGS
ncbi:TetR family transcriptional regulator [Streptomyces sp. 184]|uniref:TetR/AcrR family transcriptional regulator n=1 Tax=Streptomyces sp. 184 TaxID=1827526 RepID=UPI003891794C